MPAAPKRLQIGTREVLDVRHLFPNEPNGSTATKRWTSALAGIAVHHDGVIMAAGDRDYNGTTLNEDLARLQAIYDRGISEGWGGFPYHTVSSPNNRTFYTQDVANYGAHVARRNHQLLGHAIMGDFSSRAPRDDQLCGAALGIITLYHATGRLLDFRGHREWALAGQGTQCPGDTWWTWQQRLVLAVVTMGRLAFPRS